MKTGFIILIGLLGFISQAQSAPVPLQGVRLNDLRLLPVQSGGRVKPFDEFARETLLAMTGSRSFGSFDPSEMLVSMMVDPKGWADEKIIRISIPEVNQQLLLDPTRKMFAPNELLSSNVFLQYAEGIRSGGKSAEQVTGTGINAVSGKKDPRGEELRRVVDRMERFQAIVTGAVWTLTPTVADDPEAPWKTFAEGMMQSSPQVVAAGAMLKCYLDREVECFQEKVAVLRDSVEKAVPAFSKVSDKLKVEVWYNRLRPFLQSMILYLFAGLFWLFAARHAFARMMAKFLTFSAVFLHVLGFGLRSYVAERPPVTNMYESIIWVSLGVMVFTFLLYRKNRQVVLMSTACMLAGFALFAGDAAPLVMDPTIRPLVPVLRSNYWLTIHVLTITLSYGAFMLAMGISNVSLFQFMKIARTGESPELSQRIASLNQLSYRALMFGTVLLAAGTILGGVWADYSWGRFWGWDPKEVWALIALLAYMAVLHGRYAGWVGRFALPLWTVICFSTVVMAWYGVNFVLGAGLHSYGFSTGGQAFVASFLLAQTVFCLVVAWMHKRGRSAPLVGT
jgi:cytochrome c-type biogenesis protein CcsB